MRVLAIDPGSVILGYAVIEDPDILLAQGEVQTKGVLFHNRYQFIVDNLTRLLMYKVDTIACERVVRFRNKRVPTLEVAVIAIDKWSKSRKLPISYYSPTEWKASVLGNSQATKDEVQWYVTQSFPHLTVITEHVADAVAIGLHHLGVERLQAMAQGEK